MPVRIPGPRSTEYLSYGVAGVGVFAPFYMMMPGAEERVARSTARWAPRWERNIGFFTPRVERGIQRVEPPIRNTVQKIEQRIPFEKVAKNVESRITNGIERVSKFRKE